MKEIGLRVSIGPEIDIRGRKFNHAASHEQRKCPQPKKLRNQTKMENFTTVDGVALFYLFVFKNYKNLFDVLKNLTLEHFQFVLANFRRKNLKDFKNLLSFLKFS